MMWLIDSHYAHITIFTQLVITTAFSLENLECQELKQHNKTASAYQCHWCGLLTVHMAAEHVMCVTNCQMMTADRDRRLSNY